MVFVAIPVSLDYSTALEEMLVVGRALAGLSLPSLASLETELASEPEEPKVRMAGG